jgi:hypothetical protein
MRLEEVSPMPDVKTDHRSPATELESAMGKDERDRMSNQMEEFEGPDRREIRGDESEPAKDPGVSRS